MFKLLVLLTVISVALTVWCLVEASAADRARVRLLPKGAWIAAILLVPFVAPVGWFLVGRPSLAKERAAAAADFAEFERPGRLDEGAPSDPVKDAAYRKLLRLRAEEQRWRYEQQKSKPSEPESD